MQARRFQTNRARKIRPTRLAHFASEMESRALALVSVILLLASFASASWTPYFYPDYTNLVYGGQEGSDRYPTNICRIRSSDGLFFPGKLIPDARRCYYANGTSERSTNTNFEALGIEDEQGGTYEWIRSDSLLAPNRHPVVGAVTDDGKPIYICRTMRVPIRKGFWSGFGVLVGNMLENYPCNSPWNGGASYYVENDILYHKYGDK